MNSCVDLSLLLFFFLNKLGGWQRIARLIIIQTICCSQDPLGEVDLWMILNLFFSLCAKGIKDDGFVSSIIENRLDWIGCVLVVDFCKCRENKSS